MDVFKPTFEILNLYVAPEYNDNINKMLQFRERKKKQTEKH